jgi:hypothetical protein
MGPGYPASRQVAEDIRDRAQEAPDNVREQAQLTPIIVIGHSLRRAERRMSQGRGDGQAPGGDVW